MPVIYCSGDIFAGSGSAAFAHGCNCAGAMGKGVALDFRKRWPKMYEAYRQICAENSFHLGDVFVWQEHGQTIFNLATQKTWRTKANLNAIEGSLKKMACIANDKKISSVLMPQIGCGLGGLNWEDVKPIFETIFGQIDYLTVLVCVEYVPGISLKPTDTKSAYDSRVTIG